jgi:hypothetical protein
MEQMVASLAELNERNRAFWEAESAQAESRMADPDVFHRATVDMHGEVARLLPVYYRKSFEQALQDAAALFEDPVLLKRTHRRLSRRGGSSKKTDALGEVILEEVQKRPAITVTELLKHLQSLQDLRQVVDDIDEEAISFTDRKGHTKNAPISGLKDRLSRAKKALKSR